MKEVKYNINNSYESASSGSSNSVGDTNISRSMNLDLNEGSGLSNLVLPNLDYEVYNTSAEEGIFPNIVNSVSVVAPSYAPEYDYYNQYSTTPLVYSWMPIVPGFTPNGTHNLHNFDHIVKKLQPQPLNISVEEHSTLISDQNLKFLNSSGLNESDPKFYIFNNSGGMTFNHQLDDSCNAMDLNISSNIKSDNLNSDLSFNGKIPYLTIAASNEEDESITCVPKDEENSKNSLHEHSTVTIDECNNESHKSEDLNETKECEKADDDSESERLRNESLELLKKEDSTKMILENEKSPVVTENSYLDDESDDGQTIDLEQEKLVDKAPETMPAVRELKTMKECDDVILKKIQSSLSEMCPPLSITTLPLSLSEMLVMYKRNLEKPDDSFTAVKSCSLLLPSHSEGEAKQEQWPNVLNVKFHDVTYNRSTDCEQIEYLSVRFTEKFFKSETNSSYNHKSGPASAKKRVEKLKLLTQSPGSRLSHLANRRKVFSSANLKSTSTTSQKTFAGSRHLLIDKAKLYQKRKRVSAKKKTPGKRKTPKSAKKQLQVAKPDTATTSITKRALFVSPMHKKEGNSSSAYSKTSREVPPREQLPKRTLFSPSNKRKRSPSPDVENKFGKARRLDSPNRLMKSKSFSIAAPSTSSGSLDEHFKKTLFYRTQSDAVLNQSNDGSRSKLGYRKPLSEMDKKKLLWTASSALQARQINRDHEKFKDYMSNLCRLVKKIFSEFYNPSKSMSAQMTKFSNLMVFYVVQGRSFEEIYAMTKSKLEAQNAMKISGYIAQEDYQKINLIRKSSSLLLMTNSCSNSSLNNMTDNSDSFLDATFDKSGSDTSLNNSTSSNNENKVLRENFVNQNRGNSAKKLFSGSDSNLNLMKTSTPSSNVLKAKRQISF